MQLGQLHHEFIHLRDGNGLAPYLVDVAGLVRTAKLVPLVNGEKELRAGKEGLCIH